MPGEPQRDLLESARHLDWLPDESVYSLACRHHRLAGNVRSEQTARQLFGHPRGGFPHDLPAGLNHLSHALDLRLGTAEEIALEHTILPALLAFRDTEDRAGALTAMGSPRLGALKSRLGLPASGFGASGLLKACPTCMADDARTHGTAYWHVAHQLPGVWLCATHDQSLRYSGSKRAGQHRFDWILPECSDLQPVARNASRTADGLRFAAKRVADVSASAFERAKSTDFDPTTYHTALWAALQEHGLASRPGRLRAREASGHLQAFLEQLVHLPDWQAIAPNERIAYAKLHSAIHHPDRGHALHAVVLVASLCDSWDAFLARGRPLVDSTPAANPMDNSDGCAPLRAGFLELVVDHGQSISHAARLLGLPIATAQGWAAASGHEPPKRPSKLRSVELRRAIARLELGDPISHVAEGAGVSAVSIRRLMRTTVALRDKWSRAQHERARENARFQWLGALQLDVVVGPGAARALEPSAYAWLYRNDRVWLLQTNAGKQLPKSGNNSTVNWAQRDEDLSSACRRAALQLYEAEPSSRVTLTAVFKLVPELRAKLCHLDRLPLTARALKTLLRAR